jgi:inhibitor of KinA
MPGAPDIRWTSERSLRIQGPPPVAVAEALRGLNGVLDATPTQNATHLTLDPLAGITAQAIAGRLSKLQGQTPPEPRVHEIPACYEAPFAPDLAEVARLAGMATDEVIRLHASTEFIVAFMGFAPGFGYLTGLTEALRVPRLASPRTRLEAGSVGIAGDYSGVYALPGPGGWRIIARTKAVMFGVERPEPALLRAGDVVRFKPVSAEAFAR